MCDDKSFSLADAVDLFNDSDAFTFSVPHGSGYVEVRFIDESGLRGNDCDSFFVAGHEFGPHVLIHARSWGDAWETWIDESPTIPEEELIEAYGIADDYREEYEKIDPPPPHYAYQGPVTMQAEADAWHRRYRAACVKRLQDLSETDNPPELVEGYEYQSSASGTGIVDVGDYAWMNEIDASDVRITRRAK